MKTFSLSMLRIVLTLCLIGQPFQTALGELVAPASGGAGLATDEMGVTSTSQASGTEDSFSKPSKASNVIMGGITLPKNTLTMDFQDADVKDVLHLLALKSGLNIIYGADVTGPVTVHLDRVPFDQAFQTILTLKTLVALPMGPKVIRVVTSTTLTTEQSQAATFTRVFRLNYALADDVKKPVDAIRTASGRKGVTTVDAKTNSIVITDTIEGLKEVEDLIPVLDKKPQQVDIESKIVEVSLDNQTQTGISWAFAGSAGTNDAYKIGGSQGTASATSGPGVLASAAGGSLITPIGPSGTFGAGAAAGQGGTGVSLNSIASGPTPVGFSFLTQQGTYLLSAQISALATQGRVKILSTPHIVTTNNQEANINVADQIPYVVNTVSNGISQSAVQFISAGVKLTVKPTVNADRRITLHVKPEVSNAVGTGSANLPPTVNTRNAETTVLLRDGETIAIGGLITENINKSVTGIPFLMSIPILGYLFKTTSDRKQRTELIVFLTPKIAAE
jgi:type IV pilus assembly protein PilQ